MSTKNTLYVVDDDIEFLQLCGEALGESFDVRQFHNAADLVNALETAPPPHVIVSDHMMPGVRGLDLIRLLKKNDLDVPVILISGYMEEQERAEALDAGAYALLEKPVSMSSVQELAIEALRTGLEHMDTAAISAEALELTDISQRLLDMYKDRALEAERVLKELGLLPSSVEDQLDRILQMGKIERTYQKRRQRLIRIFNQEPTVEDILETGRKPAA